MKNKLIDYGMAILTSLTIGLLFLVFLLGGGIADSINSVGNAIIFGLSIGNTLGIYLSRTKIQHSSVSWQEIMGSFVFIFILSVLSFFLMAMFWSAITMLLILLILPTLAIIGFNMMRVIFK